jgi:glycosyltransferase involved in cell wall biosynthesis
LVTGKKIMAVASIIITCYNLGAYLQEALDSALAQTHPDFEVLLIDDGSTDPETIKVLDQLAAHPRLRVFRTENQGVARARNYGVVQSSGLYFLPLDADDRILPDYLTRAISVLEETPEAGFVGCHYRIFGDRTGECRPTIYQLPDLLVENVIPIASVVRRSCWDEVGGYSPDVGFEDWDLWLGILGRGHRGVVIPEILFEYRIRPQSRQSLNTEPNAYQQTLEMIYGRHRDLYATHLHGVLALKDRQIAYMRGHTVWLEDQVKRWHEVAQDQAAFITNYGQRAEQAWRWRTWARGQIQRVRRVAAAEQTLLGKARLITAGVARVVWRRAKRALGR